jgi:hypothetical protein
MNGKSSGTAVGEIGKSEGLVSPYDAVYIGMPVQVGDDASYPTLFRIRSARERVVLKTSAPNVYNKRDATAARNQNLGLPRYCKKHYFLNLLFIRPHTQSLRLRF